MAADVVIRPVRPGDGAACADLWVAFGRALSERLPGFREPERVGLDRWFEEQIATTAAHEYRVLGCLDDQIVGYAFAVLRQPSPHPTAALREDMTLLRAALEDIVVAEPCRGRGIGGALLDAVCTWARGQGAQRLMLHSDAEGPARRFYERHGFTVLGAMYGIDL